MLSRIRARNFLSWANLDYSIESGVTMFDGWNEDDNTSEGSGKSSYLNAIAWGAYGKVPKEEVNLDDVIKHGESGCLVLLEFDDGTQIVRSRGPNQLFMVDSSGAKIIGRDARETQVLIQDYLGASYEAFLQANYFPQNSQKRFISANQEARGKLLSEIQDLSVFDKAGKEAQALIKLETANLVQLDHKFNLLKVETGSVVTSLEMLEQFVRETKQRFEVQKEAANSRVIDCQSKMETLKSNSVARLQELSDLGDPESDESNDLLTQKSDLQEQLSALRFARKNLDEQSRSADQQRSQAARLAKRLASVEAKQLELEDFLRNPTQTCPTCNTVLQDPDLTHIEAELNECKMESGELVSALQDIGQNLLDADQDDMETLDINMMKISKSVAEIDRALSDISQRAQARSKISTQLSVLTESIQNKKIELEDLRSQFESMEAPEVEKDLAKQEKLGAKLRDLQEDQSTVENMIEKSKSYLGQLEALKLGFKEIKSYVFESALDELNHRSNNYLSMLFEVPANVRFSNRDMEIEISTSLDGVSRGLGLLSGGQFRRFCLSVDLGLSDMVSARKSSKIGLLAMDEYFHGLSEGSMEKCLNILKARTSPVLLIEHNSIFKSSVDQSRFVRLKNGTSESGE